MKRRNLYKTLSDAIAQYRLPCLGCTMNADLSWIRLLAGALLLLGEPRFGARRLASGRFWGLVHARVMRNAESVLSRAMLHK